MPNILKPTTVIRQITTQTVQGEVTVNLNITLTLAVDQAGGASLRVGAGPSHEHETHVPDWEPVGQGDLIEFGKDV